MLDGRVMQAPLRPTLWAAAAAATLLFAALASRDEVASQRAAVALSWFTGRVAGVGQQNTAQTSAGPFATEAETRRLAEAVHGLAREDDRLESRIAIVERNTDEITGSVAPTNKVTGPRTPLAEQPTLVEQPTHDASGSASPVADALKPQSLNTLAVNTLAPRLTPAFLASVIAPGVPQLDDSLPPLPPTPVVSAKTEPATEATEIPSPPARYGVDIGTAWSIQALRAHWAALHAAHPQAFDGMLPRVGLMAIPRSPHAELRLIVGPLANAESAVQLCAALVPYRVLCRPTMLDGKDVALD
jgi:hypothetical protein